MKVVSVPPTLSSNPMLVDPSRDENFVFFNSSKISFWPWISGSSLVVVGPLFCGRLLAVSLRIYWTTAESE